MTTVIPTTQAAPLHFPVRPLLACAAVGLAFDRVAEHGPNTVAGAALLAAAGLAVALVPRRTALAGRLLGATAAVLAAGLVLRASAWVAALDLLAALVALTLAVVVHRGSSLFDLTVPRLVVRALAATFDALSLPAPVLAWLGAARDRLVSSPENRRCASTYLRAGLLAAGVALLVVPLLAAGDAVFASVVDVDIDLGPLPAHLVLFTIGALAAGAMLHAAARPERDLPLPDAPTLGPVECRVLLAVLAAVYAVFAAGQVVAAAGGAERVLASAGLTYAEYARSGFFQLLGAVAVTIVVLVTMHGIGTIDDRLTRSLAVGVTALTLVCVGTAANRLALYEDAFGLTMLRLYALVAAGWLALLLMLVAASVVGLGGARRWLPGAALVSVLAMLVALTAGNPESFVVRRNVARAVGGETFDAAYVASLSSDAVPTLVAQLPRLSAADRAPLVSRLCDGAHDADASGWGWNRSRDRARDALRDVC